jgi:hypothetical protein
MEMWNTDTDCYLYDKDMYDDVCFARTMLRDNLEALRKGSAPPQVRTVIWCGFPSSFFSFLFFPKGRISSLSSFPTTSIIICLALLSLALPRSPPSFSPLIYSLQERVIDNNTRQSIFIQFAHRYISQNKALNGYIVLSSNIEEGQPNTDEPDLFLGFLCFVCLVPAIYALGEMRDEATRR